MRHLRGGGLTAQLLQSYIDDDKIALVKAVSWNVGQGGGASIAFYRPYDLPSKSIGICSGLIDYRSSSSNNSKPSGFIAYTVEIDWDAKTATCSDTSKSCKVVTDGYNNDVCYLIYASSSWSDYVQIGGAVFSA